MQCVLRNKIKSSLLFVVCCLLAVNSIAQDDELNLENFDDKPYHFGISLGFNKSHFLFTHNPKFLNSIPDDTIQVVESISSSGINLAWLVNFRISDHFNLRSPLGFTFSEKAFLYNEKYPTGTVTEKKIQSITISLPLHVAFSSDRIGNFKVYVLGGGKIDYDMASNAGARKAEDLIKLYKVDASVEVGMGFRIYFPYFVLVPELKLSSGLRNLHSYDSNLRYSNVIDQIKSKMITFSLTVE